MPGWLSALLWVVGGLTTLITFISLFYRKVIVPLRHGWDEMVKLLQQIRDSSSGVQRLAREVEGLAGAVVRLVVGIKEQVDENTSRIDRLEELRELVVDIDAGLAGLRRTVERHHPEERKR